MSTEELPASEVGPGRRGRLFSATWWSALVLVPALVVARLGDHGAVILIVGLVAAGLVFVAVVRTQPTVVTRDEVRHRKRTIRRTDVASITRPDESTALVFRGVEGQVVGLVDVFEQSGRLREALRAHGWPEVGASG
jgi:hypothetical protein